MKIRKQVYELTEQDLAEHPTWEFALDEEGEDGQDEATVRPWAGALPLDAQAGMFVVRAKFVLADGTKRSGYLTPPSDGDPSIAAVQPVIVTNANQVMFWFGVLTPTRERMQEAYDVLGRRSDEVFPIKYESDVALQTGSVSGTLVGFMRFRSFHDQSLITEK